MNFQFTNPAWLLLLLIAVPWTAWLGLKSDVQISAWRRWTAFGLRLVIVLALILAIAGLQWKRPQEGMNVFFLLDRSDSIPPEQQEAARLYLSKAATLKKPIDKAGVLAFGTDAAIDMSPNEKIGDQKIQAVVGSERTDIASAIRLGTAAFPETGQKRLVQLESGKNLFTVPQTLTEPDFYSYEVQVEAPGDSVPQNNRAINFTTVRGDPRVLLVSAEPDKDAALAETLRSANLDVKVAEVTKFPGTLAEMQSYDS